ncbi:MULTISPECIES: citrate lyase acyl carrier protein [Acetobacter]|uniref:Citrate lyase acyl carrier protein n=1 Tax=Acetobacter thailandicus TaxID=1502842 RepID=A0ABT3QBX9_9PROT|nr:MULTISPECIES: citrate lyase acyl carrier protein [Acetobacter]MBS1003357.1 citrate lyase acyl carrier protein [Acetobacter thailandicus]MCX2562808.1 citrate lyase acyl carrier protein [Acetobacter thailandicus]NHN94873.1 citrate lyase acyl carrier protein [Acetobacter thailandicus]OUI89684.1 citrate lyase subunit gamma [Acetobacter sp. DmW_043]
MKVIQKGMAGTLESSDVLVVVSPNDADDIKLSLQSKVEKQYGNAIRKAISETLAKCGVTGAKVDVRDQGALDCVIRARVEAAVYRAADEKNVKFGGQS